MSSSRLHHWLRRGRLSSRTGPRTAALPCWIVTTQAYIECVDYVAHAGDTSDRPDQAGHLRLKDGAAQTYVAVNRVHVDRMRMRHQPSKLRAHSLDEHTIVHWLAAQYAAGAREQTRGAVREIETHGAQGITADARGMRDLVPDERPTATAALGIHEVHEADTETQTRQQRPVIAEHGDASTHRE